MSPWNFKEYYAANKKKISDKRKKKYRKDPKYRSTVLQKSKDYYNEKLKRPYLADRRIFQTEEGQYISIGRLATLINKDVNTIRRYHRAGIIPQPTRVDSRGWRLYGRSEATLLQTAFRAKQRGELANLREVQAYIRQHWGDEK